MEIIWISHAAFKIKTESGIIIYLDPYKIDEDAEKADIIVSSHSHGDHFSIRDITKLMKDTTIVLGPESLLYNLERFNGKTIKIGESLVIQDIKIELVPAYTITRGTHPKNAGGAGTIIEADSTRHTNQYSIVETEGKRVYHAGDTERIPEMKDLKDITVALLPCGGTYTMNFEESTNCALDFKPEIVVPCHDWGADLNKYKDLMAKKDQSIKVEILTNKTLKI